MFRKGIGITLFVMLVGVGLALSALPAAAQHSQKTMPQTTAATTANVVATSTVTPAYDREVEFNGTISRVDGDILGVVDSGGAETPVLVVPSTRIRAQGKHHGSTSGGSALAVGMPVRVEGRGNCAGQLVAESIRYTCCNPCDPCGCGRGDH